VAISRQTLTAPYYVSWDMVRAKTSNTRCLTHRIPVPLPSMPDSVGELCLILRANTPYPPKKPGLFEKYRDFQLRAPLMSLPKRSFSQGFCQIRYSVSRMKKNGNSRQAHRARTESSIAASAKSGATALPSMRDLISRLRALS
jgi:hypothetical protein